jgi:hypothetical protein
LTLPVVAPAFGAAVPLLGVPPAATAPSRSFAAVMMPSARSAACGDLSTRGHLEFGA